MRGKTTFHIRWKLFFYDVIVFAVTSVFLLVLYEGPVKLTQRGELQQMLLAFVCVFACRLVGKIYGQIWRYGGIQCYMRLVCTDCVAFLIYVILESVLPVAHISFPRLLVLSTVNTMGALIMRMSYRYAYKCSNLETFSGKILAALLKIFAGIEVGETRDDQKIKVAIIGAGNVGVADYKTNLNYKSSGWFFLCNLYKNGKTRKRCKRMNDSAFLNSRRTGIFKDMSNGTICIPKDLRDNNGLEKNDRVELIPMQEGIYIRKAYGEKKCQ